MHAIFMLSFGIMPAMEEQMISDTASSPGEAEKWYMIWHETCLLRLNQENILKKFEMGGAERNLY